MIKIGMISFAHMHAYSYAQGVLELDNAEITGIYDDNIERGKAAAEQFNTTFYENLEDLLKQDLQAVMVCSENSKHKEHVLKAAEFKKDILCEKPIATNVADAQIMIDACERADVKLQIAYPVRFAQAIREAKTIVDSGQLGEIKALVTTNRGRNPGGWFVDPKQSGGGAVLDHTVHMVDIARWFLNEEVVEVKAEIDQMFSDIEIDDAGILDLKFASGIMMTHDCSWSKNDRYPTWGDVTIEIIGSKASLFVDAFKDHFISYSDHDAAVTELFSGNNMDFELVADFVDCVAQDREPSITGYDGLKSMEVALKAYESDEKGQVVHIQ